MPAATNCRHLRNTFHEVVLIVVKNISSCFFLLYYTQLIVCRKRHVEHIIIQEKKVESIGSFLLVTTMQIPNKTDK